jgi:hypothetical protein
MIKTDLNLPDFEENHFHIAIFKKQGSQENRTLVLLHVFSDFKFKVLKTLASPRALNIFFEWVHLCFRDHFKFFIIC